MERALAFYRLTHDANGAQALLEALRSAATASLAEPGCRASRIWRMADDSGDLLLMEEWAKKEDLERHVRTPAFRRLLSVLELSGSPPDVFYVDGPRLRGMEWIEQILGS
jgi:quinol monooxygenase YgiN